MHYNVPQFVDVEDKIAGPLTWKQLFWFLGFLAACITLYNIFELGVFLAIAIPLGLVVAAFAFYKPYGIPLISMTFHWLSFMFSPKLYVWRRMPVDKKVKFSTAKETPRQATSTEALSLEEVKNLAKVLDSPGEVLTEGKKDGIMK